MRPLWCLGWRNWGYWRRRLVRWVVSRSHVEGVALGLRRESVMPAMRMAGIRVARQLLLLVGWFVVSAGAHVGRVSRMVLWWCSSVLRIRPRPTGLVALRVLVWRSHAVAGAARCDATGIYRFCGHLTPLGAVSDGLDMPPQWVFLYGPGMARGVAARRNFRDFYGRPATAVITGM
jgi:hypothetical protein